MEKKQNIKFTQNMTGKSYIKVDDAEVVIDMAILDNDGRKNIINGLGNMLMNIACYAPKNEK